MPITGWKNTFHNQIYLWNLHSLATIVSFINNSLKLVSNATISWNGSLSGDWRSVVNPVDDEQTWHLFGVMLGSASHFFPFQFETFPSLVFLPLCFSDLANVFSNFFLGQPFSILTCSVLGLLPHPLGMRSQEVISTITTCHGLSHLCLQHTILFRSACQSLHLTTGLC